MAKATDVRPVGVTLYFLPVRTRVPLKFGSETLTSVTCARAAVTVRDRAGREATGWGETPLSVQWVWPSGTPYGERHDALSDFCVDLAEAWSEFREFGHPIEIGYDFQHQVLAEMRTAFNANRAGDAKLPYLAALVCCSVFDQALHDAYGVLHGVDTYATYGSQHMTRTLADLLEPAPHSGVHFGTSHVADFLVKTPPQRMRAWHLVGGLDALDDSGRTGSEPADGYPVTLVDWIRTDGLTCLKVKLRGNDSQWDYDRMARVGRIAVEQGVQWLSADFNCTVTDPAYVNEILDRLRDEHQHVYGMVLYVEQPFPYDLEQHRIDTRSVSARKPLFLDESAHDWQHVRLGRDLGWSGVALKTCKTQTGALLAACWAKAHGMPLMVQDLTNPMLAQVPHCRLAANVGTIMGVETNAMQFYPEASNAEAKVHPGLYRRRGGQVDLSTLGGAGFGYRAEEIARELPTPRAIFQARV